MRRDTAFGTEWWSNWIRWFCLHSLAIATFVGDLFRVEKRVKNLIKKIENFVEKVELSSKNIILVEKIVDFVERIHFFLNRFYIQKFDREEFNRRMFLICLKFCLLLRIFKVSSSSGSVFVHFKKRNRNNKCHSKNASENPKK